MVLNSKENVTYIPYLEIETIPTADVYVDDNADPGWYDATHVKTIHEGIYNATVEDTVYVYNGTYYENLIWPTAKNGIILISESGSDSTIIDGNNIGKVISINSSSIDTTTIIDGKIPDNLEPQVKKIVQTEQKNYQDKTVEEIIKLINQDNTPASNAVDKRIDKF